MYSVHLVEPTWKGYEFRSTRSTKVLRCYEPTRWRKTWANTSRSNVKIWYSFTGFYLFREWGESWFVCLFAQQIMLSQISPLQRYAGYVSGKRWSKTINKKLIAQWIDRRSVKTRHWSAGVGLRINTVQRDFRDIFYLFIAKKLSFDSNEKMYFYSLFFLSFFFVMTFIANWFVV